MRNLPLFVLSHFFPENLLSFVQETFGAIRTVRSFAQEDFEMSRYSEKVDETLQLGLKQAVSSPNAFFSTIDKLKMLSVID